MISPKSLHIARQLAGLVLKHEREAGQNGGPIACGVSSQLEASCRAISEQQLLSAIRRHRLETPLAADPLVLQLIPQLADRVKVLARKEHMAALALASLTREMAALFECAGIPMLVIKGVPLALQTTGLLTSRGRGDLDLLVDPSQLPQSIRLLQSVGFHQSKKKFIQASNSFVGCYVSWVGYELSLHRRSATGTQWIDLHWAASNVRDPLPKFEQACLHSERLSINGQLVKTFCSVDAFRHACAHAAKDQWTSLRNMIDIDRLIRLIPAELTIEKCPVVRMSMHALVPVSNSFPDGDKKECDSREAKWIVERSTNNQLISNGIWHRGINESRSLRESALKLVWGFKTSTDLLDWIRLAAGYILPPSCFMEKEKSITGFVVALVRRSLFVSKELLRHKKAI